MKKFIKNNKIFLVFLVFFLVVLLQHQFMYLYHDDYGYASLSYAYKVDGVEGHNVNMSQILEFLKGHYLTWGGRVLTFFFEIFLLTKGIYLFRLIQSIIITLIFFLIYSIVKKCSNQKVNDLLLAVCTITCYGLFEIMILRTGIFWASASVSYLFPVLPFLLFVYLYQDSKEKKFKNQLSKVLFYLFMGVMVFLATFSQEQVGFAALGYIMILSIYNVIRTKKISKLDLIMCIIAIVGFGILMLAPGNALRKLHPTSIEFYSKPLLERILCGTENLILGNFSMYTKLFNIVLYISICYAAYKVVKCNKGIKLISKLSLASIVCIIFVTMIQQDGYFQWMYNLSTKGIYKILIMGIFIVQLLLMFYSVIVYLFERKKYKLINVVLSAILSVACMIFAPYFAIRSSIIFEILCYIYILYVFQEVYCSLKEKEYIMYIILPIILVALCNMSVITKGYYLNSSINKENDKILSETSIRIKNGENIEKVTLKKLNNILYSGDQPYTEGNDYITTYIKEYYNLPNNIKIIYE